MFSSFDLHLPVGLIGFKLPEEARLLYQQIQEQIAFYYAQPVRNTEVIIILQMIDHLHASTFKPVVCMSIGDYLRVQLLSKNVNIVFHTVLLLDCIIKNSGSHMHESLGRRKFMKTLSLIARRHYFGNTVEKRRVGMLAVDCIQAWAQEFRTSDSNDYYPHFYQTYQKLLFKYNISFPRAENDSTRGPVSLGAFSMSQRQLMVSVNSSLGMNVDPDSSLSSEQQKHSHDFNDAVPSWQFIESMEEERKSQDNMSELSSNQFFDTPEERERSDASEDGTNSSPATASWYSVKSTTIAEYPTSKAILLTFRSGESRQEVRERINTSAELASLTSTVRAAFSPITSPQRLSISTSHWQSPLRRYSNTSGEQLEANQNCSSESSSNRSESSHNSSETFVTACSTGTVGERQISITSGNVAPELGKPITLPRNNTCKPKWNTYSPSHSNVEIRFYGNQRIVVKSITK
jgi:hypothetical protein